MLKCIKKRPQNVPTVSYDNALLAYKSFYMRKMMFPAIFTVCKQVWFSKKCVAISRACVVVKFLCCCIKNLKINLIIKILLLS